RLSIVDCRLSIVDCRLSIVDCRLSIVDCRLSIVKLVNFNIIRPGTIFNGQKINNSEYSSIFTLPTSGCLKPYSAKTERFPFK
ncbi:MAG: hypothetical protein IKN18_06055, partial [Neisseriaceae bacterium]|nr:hypothetical protein [Neisseriaceae bacterium]